MGGVDLIVSLIKVGAVFGLLIVTLRLLSRSRGLRGSSRDRRSVPTLEVIEKMRVGRSSSVVTVRVGDRALLLGVTDSQISTLADVTETLDESDDVDGASGIDAGEDVDVRGSVMDHALELLRSGRFRAP